MTKLEKIDGVIINTGSFSGGHGSVQMGVFGQYKRALKKQKDRSEVWKRFRENHPKQENDNG